MNSIDLAWKIRRHGIEMTHLSGGSHIGAVLSVADIIAVLYADVANVNPQEPKWKDRDRVILSKGHAGASIYAALAEKGIIDNAGVPVKVLGNGKLTKKLTVKLSAYSKSAAEKITAAGGKAEVNE